MTAGEYRSIVWIGAILAAIGYWLASRLGLDGAPLFALKGSAVGLLAVGAAVTARSVDGWLLTAMLALGALGDVLIDAVGLAAGAAAFLVAHAVAIVLFLRNRRPALSTSQRLLALVLVPAVVFIAWRLPTDRELATGVAVYALVLAIMAALAWTSRFPRYRTGIGAMLFVVSDLLIFARLGPLADSPIPDLLVWPLYFTGQALIAWGVVTTLQGPIAIKLARLP